MSIWIAIGLVLLISLITIVLPLIRQQKTPSGDHNAMVYQDQLAEIESDVERGLLNKTEADALAAEITKRLNQTNSDQQPTTLASRQQMFVAVAIILILPLAALGLYRELGSPGKPDLPYAERKFAPPNNTANMIQLVDALEKRMLENPEKIDGWLLLGRSQMSLERYSKAALAFKQAFQIDSTRAEIATAIGEASFMAAGAEFDADARRYFLLAQNLNPHEHKALFYLGLDLAQQNKYREAVQIWIDLLAISPSDAPWLTTVRQRLEKAATSGNLKLADFKSRLDPIPAQQPPTTSGPTADDVKAAQEMSPEDRQAFIRSMVERLADRLKVEPNDLAGWRRLARAYKVLGETEKAAAAEARIKALEK